MYAGGRRVTDIAIDVAGEWSKKPGHVVWIGLLEPEHALLARIQAQLGLHYLAIEDAAKAHQHPKIEQYGDALFIVARTAQIVHDKIAFGETHLFVGRGYIVSVRHGASASYAAVRERCESCPTTLSHGEDYILYAILDFIVDNFMPVLEPIQREVDAIEDGVFRAPLPTYEVQRLYTLRRELLVTEAGIDDGEAILVGEIERPLGIGVDVVVITSEMFVNRGDHIELTLTAEQVRDRLARPER